MIQITAQMRVLVAIEGHASPENGRQLGLSRGKTQ